MRTLVFDGRTGASGDMILAALVAVGADPDVLRPVEEALGIDYRIDETTKQGVTAVTVDVRYVEEHGERTTEAHGGGSRSNGDSEHDHDPEHDDSAGHGGAHDHGEHDHGSKHDHDHTHAEGHGPTRTYAECREIVEEMGLSESVMNDAVAIFRILGEAEASVHGTDLEATTFHEVGADDAIADIVGAVLLLEDLGVESVFSTPVFAGGGEVSTSHGRYPVPTPVVSYIAEHATWELRGGPIERELLTPTGAAVLAHLAEGVGSLPSLSVETSGFGAGDASISGRPNVLRALVGTRSGGLKRESMRMLETNVDDVTPEAIGGLQSTLMEAGARDVTVVPATMKKSRPGHLIKVIVPPEDVEAVASRLASETGTLGVRETAFRHRLIADRRHETVEIEAGGNRHELTVKVGTYDDGTVYDVSAEYDEAAAVAAETDLPTREVQRRAEAAYHDSPNE
ncbi:MAG: nickel pincer cofactor biosynthesis protein LarC [Natronomonas sp.]